MTELRSCGDRTMELVLLRHGSTSGNAEHRYVGRTDEPLSQAGAREARESGVREDVGCVYVSPLQRARQTAAICFPRARQVVVDGLREMDFGDFEGRTANEMADDPAYRAWVEGMCVGRCPGGESRDEFVARSWVAVRNVALGAATEDVGKARASRRVVIVAHGGTVMSAMSKLVRAEGRDDDPLAYFSWHVGTCQGFRLLLRVDGGGLQALSWSRLSGVRDL